MALSGLRAYGATFFVFTDYMRPSMRLVALMELPVIYVFTHDSIAVGEDGPTHEPVEHAAALRTIPHLTVLQSVTLAPRLVRGDADEAAGLFDGIDEGSGVEGVEGAQVNHLSVDAFSREDLGRLHREPDLRAGRDDDRVGAVAAVAQHVAAAGGAGQLLRGPVLILTTLPPRTSVAIWTSGSLASARLSSWGPFSSWSSTPLESAPRILMPILNSFWKKSWENSVRNFIFSLVCSILQSDGSSNFRIRSVPSSRTLEQSRRV